MAKASKPSFNVADDPWIQVTMRDGTFQEVSLRFALKNSQDVASIGGDIPQQAIAIVRFLLAVMYRSYGLAYDPGMSHIQMVTLWQQVWEEGVLDPEIIDDYLDEFHDRFELFGEKPFMQVAGLEYVSKDKEFDPISELIADVPKPEKFLFSMRSKAAPGVISFAESVRWLVFYCCYDFAGIKTPVRGNTKAKGGRVYAPKGLPGVGWMGSIGSVIVEGDSLFQTLMLNWSMFDERTSPGCLFGIEGDFPSWERDDVSPDGSEYSPVGPASLFTVLDRRMRLIPDESGSGVRGFIGCYGDIVRPTEASSFETMTAWRESEQQKKKLGLAVAPLMPVVHDCKKALWRGLGPLLVSTSGSNRKDLRPSVIWWFGRLRDEGVCGLPTALRIHAQGIEYEPRHQSVITNAYDDVVEVGDALMNGDRVAVSYAVETISKIDEGVSLLVTLSKRLQAASGNKRDGDPLKRASADVRERAYLALGDLSLGRLREFTAGCDANAYCLEWRNEAKAILVRLGRQCEMESETPRFDRQRGPSVAEAWSMFSAGLGKVFGTVKDK